MFTAAAKNGREDGSECDGRVQAERELVCPVQREAESKAYPPSQWSCELQQFLHQYSSINMTRCVCRPCDSDLRRGLRGKYPVGQTFTPRWQVREEKKMSLYV